MIEIEEHCAATIRELRKKKGLTLKECEQLSQGKFKAVVMGSYERGTRAISLERLQEIADFYGVPIHYFFKIEEPIHEDGKFTFDLRKIKNTMYSEESFERVKSLLTHFIHMRSDWNGEVLSIRQSDGDLLGAITGDREILKKLRFHGFFLNAKS